MKKLILSSAMFMFAIGAFAQEMGGSVARIGVKAGVNLSRINYSGPNASTINDYVKDNVGYNFTVFGDFGVGRNFFIQPGISLQNKGTKLEGTLPNPSGGTVTGTNKVDVMAIEVPVNAVLRIPAGDAGAVHISAGPYIGFNIDGKSTTNVTSGGTVGKTESDLKFGSSTTDDLSSVEYGANFGLGFRMNNGFLLGANYGLGMGNLIPKDNRSNDNKATNRILGFSVGYSF